MSESTPESAGHGNREIEWQLQCNDLVAVRHWLEGNPPLEGLVIEPLPTLEIHDTYLDTDDWRLHRAGLALRLRAQDRKVEATLKSLEPASDARADRFEVSESLPEATPRTLEHAPGPVGSRVRAVSGSQGLRPLFEVRTERQRYAVRRPGTDPALAEIDLDESEFTPPEGQDPSGALRRVEVEAINAPDEALPALVETLRTECALTPATDSKFEQGLRSAGLSPTSPRVFEPTIVHAGMTLQQVAFANLRRHLSAWYAQELRARLGDDPRAVHELRNAGRRLDAILGEFREHLPGPLFQLRASFKPLLRALGEVRDLDVALEELEGFAHRMNPLEREALEPLGSHLRDARRAAHTRLLQELDVPATHRTLEWLAQALDDGAGGAQAAGGEPVLIAAPGLLEARWRKVRKAARRLGTDSSPADYHRVRRRLKKLRYLLETVTPLYHRRAERALQALRRWQDTLGALQDAAVSSDSLKAMASSPDQRFAPATLLLMGRLLEHHERAARRARDRQRKRCRRFQRRWRQLSRRLRNIAGHAAAPPSFQG
ncbi:MAG: CHAD domain-containing protein [Steroidobacteraceae bacterium]